MWITLWDRDFESDTTIVGDGKQGIDGVKLPSLLIGIVDTTHSETELEAKRWCITKDLCDLYQTLALDVESQFTAIDDDLLDRIGEEWICALQFIRYLIEVGTKGTLT
jgi:hypothetical protein